MYFSCAGGVGLSFCCGLSDCSGFAVDVGAGWRLNSGYNFGFRCCGHFDAGGRRLSGFLCQAFGFALTATNFARVVGCAATGNHWCSDFNDLGHGSCLRYCFSSNLDDYRRHVCRCCNNFWRCFGNGGRRFNSCSHCLHSFSFYSWGRLNDHFA